MSVSNFFYGPLICRNKVVEKFFKKLSAAAYVLKCRQKKFLLDVNFLTRSNFKFSVTMELAYLSLSLSLSLSLNNSHSAKLTPTIVHLYYVFPSLLFSCKQCLTSLCSAVPTLCAQLWLVSSIVNLFLRLSDSCP